MNYYKRHLGDYAKNTRTLSTYEHGVYNLVLDLYYTDECPVSTQDAYDVCRASTDQEMASVDKVLRKFFVQEGEAWRHHRADEEIAKYKEKSAKNKAIGSLGGRQKAINSQTDSESETPSETLDECLAKENPSHKPLATSQEKEQKLTPTALGAGAPSADESACKTVLTCYHAALPNCARIGVLNPKRRRRILMADKLARKVCAEQGWEFDRRWFWENYFGECRNDPWMRGDVPNPKNPKWRQNLDVLIAEDRFASIMDAVIAVESERDAA